ncbi:hypothetical protein HED22_07365 [Thalassospira sp. HF15]|uniref:O-antigen ligase family protein n=1 Tax=Thalassospira sp. HF15 TaxID=2722755 RepID=UPI00142F923B|nr:O-antigen ligase family protein [Thalassospira sp. HF15]NIY75457.1 hypothetical protein [Thalassospira sp. HF15]
MSGFLQKRYPVPDFWYGVLVGLLILLPFMRIRIDYQFVELSGALQFIVFVAGFVGLTLATTIKISSLKTVLLERATVLLGLWCIYACASVFWSEYPLLTLKRSILAIFPAVMLYLAAALVDKPETVVKGFVLGLSGITTICVVYAVIGLFADLWNTYPARRGTIYLFGLEFSQTLGQRLFLIDGELVKLQRFSGFFPNPNGLGMVAAICMLLLAGIRQDAPKACRVLFALMLVGVILSGSRSAVLILVSGFLYLFLSRVANYRFLVAVMVIAALLIPSVIVMMKGDLLQLSILPAWVFEQESLIASIRGPFLLEASQAALGNWAFGGGFGVGAEVSFGASAGQMAVHSVFMNAVIETGVVGLTLLVAMWISFILVGSRQLNGNSRIDKVMGCISVTLVALFVAQSVDLSVTRFHYIHLIFFFMVGLLFSFQRTELEKRI